MYVERRTKNEERIKCLAFSVTCALHFRQQLPTLLCYSSRALCNMYSQIFTFVIFAFGLLTVTIAKSLDFPLSNACPTPSKQVLGCLSEWTCRHVINLDLRCLLNINSHPLLGNLLGTNGITGGLLDGLLGR